jgi:hypothetical protein
VCTSAVETHCHSQAPPLRRPGTALCLADLTSSVKVAVPLGSYSANGRCLSSTRVMTPTGPSFEGGGTISPAGCRTSTSFA